MRSFSYILVLIILITSKKENAKYAPISLHGIILKAELVIQGEIENVDTKYFSLKIRKKIFGNYKSSTIKIKKFQDWTCAKRWTNYREGQEVLVFLTKDTNKDWSIMSGGGEGELPIVKENIFFNSYNEFTSPFPIKSGMHKVYNANFSGFKLNLNEFIIAITDLRESFKLLNGDNTFSWEIKPIYPIDRLNLIIRKSFLNKWLIDECLATIAYKR